MKKILTITTITLLSFMLLTGCDKKEDVVDTTKSNTNEGVIKDQIVDGLKFTNTALVIESTGSVLTTKVTNTSSETKTVKTFSIVVKDEDGNVLVTLPGYIGGEIKASESKEISGTTELDLSKASSIEYTINN